MKPQFSNSSRIAWTGPEIKQVVRSRGHAVHFLQDFYFSRHNSPRPSLRQCNHLPVFPAQSCRVRQSFHFSRINVPIISLISCVTEVCLVRFSGLRLSCFSFSFSLRVLYAVNEFNGFFLKTTFKDAKQNWVRTFFF